MTVRLEEIREYIDKNVKILSKSETDYYIQKVDSDLITIDADLLYDLYNLHGIFRKGIKPDVITKQDLETDIKNAKSVGLNIEIGKDLADLTHKTVNKLEKQNIKLKDIYNIAVITDKDEVNYVSITNVDFLVRTVIYFDKSMIKVKKVQDFLKEIADIRKDEQEVRRERNKQAKRDKVERTLKSVLDSKQENKDTKLINRTDIKASKHEYNEDRLIKEETVNLFRLQSKYIEKEITSNIFKYSRQLKGKPNNNITKQEVFIRYDESISKLFRQKIKDKQMMNTAILCVNNIEDTGLNGEQFRLTNPEYYIYTDTKDFEERMSVRTEEIYYLILLNALSSLSKLNFKDIPISEINMLKVKLRLLLQNVEDESVFDKQNSNRATVQYTMLSNLNTINSLSFVDYDTKSIYVIANVTELNDTPIKRYLDSKRRATSLLRVMLDSSKNVIDNRTAFLTVTNKANNAKEVSNNIYKAVEISKIEALIAEVSNLLAKVPLDDINKVKNLVGDMLKTIINNR